MRFAEAEFFLSAPKKDGKPLRWHLQIVHNAIGQFGESQAQHIPEEYHEAWDMFVNSPQIPLELEYLWKGFLELHNARGAGMAPESLSYSDVDAWARLNRITLQKFELSTIFALDRVYFKSMEKTSKK
ncbi:phage tail assembly chaperone [Undibacterium sp. SXout7W]|uniref:phage tail assembly chaperone n=1 Tax=Undibacterium sp. SXout7W TaxID=3413049 RepID=UPI003BF003D4